MRKTAILVLLLIAAVVALHAAPAIPEIDRIRIAEAYRIGEKLEDDLWLGLSSPSRLTTVLR